MFDECNKWMTEFLAETCSSCYWCCLRPGFRGQSVKQTFVPSDEKWILWTFRRAHILFSRVAKTFQFDNGSTRCDYKRKFSNNFHHHIARKQQLQRQAASLLIWVLTSAPFAAMLLLINCTYDRIAFNTEWQMDSVRAKYFRDDTATVVTANDNNSYVNTLLSEWNRTTSRWIHSTHTTIENCWFSIAWRNMSAGRMILTSECYVPGRVYGNLMKCEFLSRFLAQSCYKFQLSLVNCRTCSLQKQHFYFVFCNFRCFT